MTPVIIVIVALFVLAAVIYTIKFLKRPTADSSRRQMDLAMVGLNQMIRKNPNDPVAFTKRGVIRFKKGDPKGALADLDRAVQLDPSSTEAHYHRGVVLQSQGEVSKADKEYNWVMAHSEDPFYKTAVSSRLIGLHKGVRR